MNVKELREKHSLSQQDLADKTGIPKDRIAKWEQGKGSPKLEDSKKLEAFFKELVPRNGTLSDSKPRGEAADYKDKYIHVLEDRANLEKEIMQYARKNQALLKTVVEWLAMIHAKAEKKKPEEVQAEMNNRFLQHLQALRKDGI